MFGSWNLSGACRHQSDVYTHVHIYIYIYIFIYLFVHIWDTLYILSLLGKCVHLTPWQMSDADLNAATEVAQNIPKSYNHELGRYKCHDLHAAPRMDSGEEAGSSGCASVRGAKEPPEGYQHRETEASFCVPAGFSHLPMHLPVFSFSGCISDKGLNMHHQKKLSRCSEESVEAHILGDFLEDYVRKHRRFRWAVVHGEF